MTRAGKLWSSWAVRGLVVAGGVKALLWLLGSGFRALAVVELLDAATSLVIVGALGYLLVRLGVQLQRVLLWRVRRKLILSYVFIGLIPVLLVGVFFLLAGTLTLLSASSFLVKRTLDDLVDQAGAAAEAVAGEIAEVTASASGSSNVTFDLARHQLVLARRQPDASLALLSAAVDGAADLAAGPWRHGTPPSRWPSWSDSERFSGLIVSEREGSREIVARAAYRLPALSPWDAVVVDLPVGDAAARRFLQETGIELGTVVFDQAGTPDTPSSQALGSNATGPLAGVDGLRWVSFLQYTDWSTGNDDFLNLEIRVAPGDLYTRLFGGQDGFGDLGLANAFIVALAVVGGLFLVIEATALIMGFALARSITGAIHQLFVGTEHVRSGDFGHRIDVTSGDQLGELAESFNSMTRSVEDLLEQAEEKKRLEEELRIARRIQMSLLPRDIVSMLGVTVAATCVPAREVGGDYYDFIPLGERRLGILVADVSGKGTSAAFYMAELKGLILSVSRIYESPQRLLIEVNRIIAGHIDSRSFITMMYAVLDLDEGTLTYARAGHTPLIYVKGSSECPKAEILTPDGLVVGLDGFQSTFEDLIEEDTLAISSGDVVVLFTDGVSEAMNEADDMFGEERLSRLVEEHVKLGVEELRERILTEVETFVGTASQHDDMTLVLLRIGQDADGSAN